MSHGNRGSPFSSQVLENLGIKSLFFLFDEENFAKYKNQEFSYDYIPEGSHLNITYADIVVTLESGGYYLVVDNTDEGLASPPQDGINNFATFSYNINYPVLSDMLCFFVGVIAIIIIVILIIFVIVRKIRQTTTYPQSYPQQQQTYQQTTQQQTYPCLTCGHPLRYVNEYQRWHCDTCRKYV